MKISIEMKKTNEKIIARKWRTLRKTVSHFWYSVLYFILSTHNVKSLQLCKTKGQRFLYSSRSHSGSDIGISSYSWTMHSKQTQLTQYTISIFLLWNMNRDAYSGGCVDLYCYLSSPPYSSSLLLQYHFHCQMKKIAQMIRYSRSILPFSW